jgi:protein disulfide-isomerase-like protein
MPDPLPTRMAWLLLFVLALRLSLAAPDQKEVLLTAENYSDEVGGHDLTLVAFYTPSCPHCQQLMPEYAKAAALLSQSEMSDVRLAKIDCTAEQELCDKQNIVGYPTVLVFRHGDKESSLEYEGSRSADAIVSYVKKLAGPLLSELSKVEELEEFRAAPSVAVVAYSDDESVRSLVEKEPKSCVPRSALGSPLRASPQAARPLSMLTFPSPTARSQCWKSSPASRLSCDSCAQSRSL